jgi:hypothetical protein
MLYPAELRVHFFVKSNIPNVNIPTIIKMFGSIGIGSCSSHHHGGLGVLHGLRYAGSSTPLLHS